MSKKSPVADRMAMVEKRYGRTTGASKGSKPPPSKPKVRPTVGKDKVGVKATWKF